MTRKSQRTCEAPPPSNPVDGPAGPVTVCPAFPCSTSPETSRLVADPKGTPRCVTCGQGYGAPPPKAEAVTVYDALCMKEPWLMLLVEGLKTLETRTTCLRKEGGEVVLTSSRSVDDRAWKNPLVGGRLDADQKRRALAGLGCLAALATFGDCRPGLPGVEDEAAMIDLQTPDGPRWVYPVSRGRLLQRRNTVRLRPDGTLTPGSMQGFFKIPAGEVRKVYE